MCISCTFDYLHSLTSFSCSTQILVLMCIVLGVICDCPWLILSLHVSLWAWNVTQMSKILGCGEGHIQLSGSPDWYAGRPCTNVHSWSTVCADRDSSFDWPLCRLCTDVHSWSAVCADLDSSFDWPVGRPHSNVHSWSTVCVTSAVHMIDMWVGYALLRTLEQQYIICSPR